MKSMAVIEILAVFCLMFILDSCQGKPFIDPKFLLKGNGGLNDVNKNFNLNLKPGRDLGNMKKDPWPQNFQLKSPYPNSIQGKIGGNVWQNPDKTVGFDLDLKPGMALNRGGGLSSSLNAQGTFKWQNPDKSLGFDLDLKPGMVWNSRGGMSPSFDALGTFKWGFGK